MNRAIIRPRQRIERTEYFWRFDSTTVPGAGYGFDCTVTGVLLNTRHRENYAACVAAVARGELTAGVIDSRVVSHTEDAVLKCTCGHHVVLSDPLDNECDRCHRWFNMVGQPVINPNSALARALRDEEARYAD